VELTAMIDLPGIHTPENDAFVHAVSDAIAAATGERHPPAAATYFTDAAVLTPAYGGIPTVVLGPGEMALCHQTDEYCRASRIEQAAAAYVEIARSWCGA
jgi:succinyl-diaminopimelate desuccinylase